MNCPICKTKLNVSPDTICRDYNNIKCPIKDINNTHTHYEKYIIYNNTRADEIEAIYLFPFLIKNVFMHYHVDSRLGKDITEIIPAHTLTSCYLFKYNNEYKQIFQLPHHIKPDTEDKLRERIKLLLLLL